MADGRTERSRRTRSRIIDAARRRFTADGYVATTIEAIADEAGVAVQTVYYSFGNKHTILAAVLDVAVSGDEEGVPFEAQPWLDDLRALDDPDSKVARFAGMVVDIVARAAPVYEVIREAAADPDVAELLRRNRTSRYSVQRQLLEALSREVGVSEGVEFDHAVDVFYGVANEEVYGLLVNERGWSHDRYRDWLTGVVTSCLLRR